MHPVSWTILICSVAERPKQLGELLDKLYRQIDGRYIEVLVLADDCKLSIGAKRNKLLNMATGDYVCFIDDDDMIADTYVSEIYEGLTYRVDYAGFRLQHYWNGEKSKPTIHSIKYDKWWEDENYYYRNITHLNPIKRDIALTQKFEEKNFGEDEDWGVRIFKSGLVQTEHFVDNIMYHYYYSPENSVSGRRS